MPPSAKPTTRKSPARDRAVMPTSAGTRPVAVPCASKSRTSRSTATPMPPGRRLSATPPVARVRSPAEVRPRIRACPAASTAHPFLSATTRRSPGRRTCRRRRSFRGDQISSSVSEVATQSNSEPVDSSANRARATLRRQAAGEGGGRVVPLGLRGWSQPRCVYSSFPSGRSRGARHRGRPVRVFQIRTVESSLVVAAKRPSGLNRMEFISARWPRRVTAAPAARSQIIPLPLEQATATCCPWASTSRL